MNIYTFNTQSVDISWTYTFNTQSVGASNRQVIYDLMMEQMQTVYCIVNVYVFRIKETG